ncbi:late competence development ComFB family protein [Ruminiclostridium josui]|uniref:late competence development ComFB family protein n=1 Tax=Ruminiclostridium josui TaxID=1499 RepID=UPI000464DF8F|nr:competence protein ComFB [Ruminiclostridium josui]
MVTLKNYMEEVVFNLMDGVLDDINMCKCELCVKDIAALALNSLPPKYIASEKGELYSKVNSLRNQFEVDVISAITKAAVLVKSAPRHK